MKNDNFNDSIQVDNNEEPTLFKTTILFLEEHFNDFQLPWQMKWDAKMLSYWWDNELMWVNDVWNI